MNLCFTAISEHGNAVGGPFGVATANLTPSPADLPAGVYIARATHNGAHHQGVLHHGPRLTFGAGATTELHLLHFDAQTYGETFFVQVEKRLRDVQQFQNADALFTQIEADIAQTQKYFMRESVLQQIATMTPEQRQTATQNALSHINAHIEQLRPDRIFAFAPSGHELPFIAAAQSQWNALPWAFPRVAGGTMAFYAAAWNDLAPGAFGIMEPPINAPEQRPTERSLVLVPAVGATQAGARLGRGGGYYDQFLATLPAGATSLCVLPACAIVDALPTQPHDVKVDIVLAAQPVAQYDSSMHIPSFSLSASNGQTYSEADLAQGRWVLFAYPKDNTPGCTLEAIAFSRQQESFAAAGVQVLGISKGTVKSKEKFCAQHDLTVPLLADEDLTLLTALDAVKKKSMFGKSYMGIVRTTWLIENGVITHTWPGVIPLGHVKNVLAHVQA